MVRSELVGKLRLLPLQVGDCRLLLLDERVRQDRRNRVERGAIVLHGLDLVVRRLLLDPLGLRARHGRVQVGQLLHDDVLPLFERHGVGLLAVALQRLLAHFHLLPLLRQTLAEPVGRLLRCEKLELEVLLDVGLRQPVCDLRSKLGIG